MKQKRAKIKQMYTFLKEPIRNAIWNIQSLEFKNSDEINARHN